MDQAKKREVRKNSYEIQANDLFISLKSSYEIGRLSEYILLGTLPQDQLRRICVELIIEIIVTEKNNAKICATKLMRDLPPLESVMPLKRIRGKNLFNPKYFLHTHFIRKDSSWPPLPSFADVPSTFSFHPQSRLFLGHPGGMVEYRRPRFDPVSGKKLGTNVDGLDLIARFLKTKDIVTAPLLGRRTLDSLSNVEMLPLEKEFTERSGMIVSTGSWGSSEAGVMMDVLNSV